SMLYTVLIDIYPPSLHDALPIWTFDVRRLYPDREALRLCAFIQSNLEWHTAQRARIPRKPAKRPLAWASIIQPRRNHYFMRPARSEEHTSELQSRENLVCRLLLE